MEVGDQHPQVVVIVDPAAVDSVDEQAVDGLPVERATPAKRNERRCLTRRRRCLTPRKAVGGHEAKAVSCATKAVGGHEARAVSHRAIIDEMMSAPDRMSAGENS